MTTTRKLLLMAGVPLLVSSVQCRKDRGSNDAADSTAGPAPAASAGVAGVSEFSSGSGLTGLGFDGARGRIWVYNGSDLRSFGLDGRALDTIPSPGERADDVDVEIAPAALSLAGVAMPAGTLLLINGETGAAEVYAIDDAGVVLATLTTEFGAGHVVGGAWHPGRGTLFLLQDNQPAGELANRVAEIDAATGRVLSSFGIAERINVLYGDLDVTAGGNLLIASSSDSRLAEFTPAGEFVSYRALPEGVSSISGLGIDGERGAGWVAGTGGTVWRVTGLGR